MTGLLVSLPCVATAASITTEASGICDIQLAGVIESGDAAKLEQSIAGLAVKDQNILCLDSPGGSLKAATDMASLVHEKGIGTHVGAGASCESSCSIVYFMGTRITGSSKSISRRLAPGGRIGIHAPSLQVDPEADFKGRTVSRAFDLALQAAGMVTTLGQKTDAKSGDNWIPVDVVNHLLTTPFTEMFHVSETGAAQDWNIDVANLEWPAEMSNAYVWNMCNFGVRERMGWSHTIATKDFDGFRSELGTEPVGLGLRHLVGQGNTGVSERFNAVSGYRAGSLRFGCVIDVAFSVVERADYTVSACVTAVGDATVPQRIVCDNPNDRVVIGTSLAGFAPDVALDDLDVAAAEMRQSGMPSR
ncbi:hypothetical protein [Antarctobacter sp.]|uniref:hypothetical protein n=1 Tax=Antarctobacter sp. TaxID=1872577 RepID=UPI003A90CE69